MWRISLLRRNLKHLLSESHHCGATAQHSCVSRQTRPLHHLNHVHTRYSQLGCYQDSIFLQSKGFRCTDFEPLGNNSRRRSYGAAAEANVSASEEECDEIQQVVDQKTPKRRIQPTPKFKKLRDRQLKIECDAWKDAAREYQDLISDMCEKKLAPNLPYIKQLFLGWFEPLRDAIAAEQELCKPVKSHAPYAPYFNLLPADMMAVITMHKMVGLVMAHGYCRTVEATSSVGEAIENEVRIYQYLQSPKSKFMPLNRTSEEGFVDKAEEQEKLRKKVQTLMKSQNVYAVRKIVGRQENWEHWGQDVLVKLGSRLIEILMETAYIQPPVAHMEDTPPEIRPAFVHTAKSVDTPHGPRRYGVIECDPLVRKGLEKTPRHTVIPYMPMLVPPLKWTGYSRGAYLFLPSYVMRTHRAKLQREALRRSPKDKLVHLFQALDTLGNTKWKVNKRILSVIDRIWTDGGGLADLVDRDDAPLPIKPDTEDESEIKKWKWKVREVKKENSERHAERCDVELKLAVARQIKDEEGVFYPHNIDFRGRAYPMHAYLNHLGSDLCRGILEFAEGRPLGKSGLRWLKVHLASLYGGGVDKLSFEDRIAFTENHLEDLFDSADRPLEGNRWWLGAEDPFQCLATCMNLSEALRSPYPETTISHIPVHQDGSCNGLQHYAALGRDKVGAAAVNLVRGDKPADVYSGIAARVLDTLKSDAAKDPEVHPEAAFARLLINQVDRKFVKQTVMTSVYGVTFIGARDQVKKRLKERGAIEDDNQCFHAAGYAAKIILAALEEMFTAARNIMMWLGECAKIIATGNQPVRWTTPLGLPVVQPYHQKGKHHIKTSLQVLTLQCDTDKVMVSRHKTAFPPNFVHSLDGCHMMKTAIACSEVGLNFAGVHDSYWTHACDVDTLNKILREKFVELYEEPVLENLLKEFQQSFPKLKFPPLPERGDFDLKEVLEATYFFN